MKRALVLGVLLVCVLFSGQSLYAQLADRGVITGLVTDSSGSAIPDAKVTIINQETNVRTVVGTNSAGNYSTPPLILGTYTVEVEKEGFKLATNRGIVLTGGQTYRQDVKLDVGAVTQSITVEGGAEQINTENATVSHSIGESYYRDLPAAMGADIRLAESLLQLQPGFVPMQPNGDAIFRGSQFTSRINGGQTLATENWFDGAAFGYAEGHQGTQESSVPYTSVQEMTVVENTFSAQYGHTSGGFITYTTKSGTDQFHGNLYDFFSNDKLDAGNFFFAGKIPNKKLPLTQNNWGAAVGGPVPKILGKTFWFFNVDGLDYHSTVNTGFVNTLPTPLQRQGDFSEFLNTNTIIAHDALGRPIYQGEIFNPATTRTVGGVPVRDGYGFDPVTGLPIAGQANVIPANDPLRSSLAAFMIPNIPALDRNTLAVNGFGGSSDDNNKINVRTWLFRIDHTFNNKFSIANTYYQNNRPRIAHCGGPEGCNTVHNGITDSAQNDTYIGQGFFQRITNHFEHLQMNWVIKPNLFNHTTIAYDRWHMQGSQLAGGVGWNKKLGLGLPDQPVFDNAGFPQITFSGPQGYTSYGTPWASGGSDINNRYQFLDDVTWIRGKHTIKAGIEYRYMTFPQTGWAVNTGGHFNFSANETAGFDATGANRNDGSGNGFASLILGQVDSGNFSAPFNYMPKMKYSSPWVNDDFKLSSKLTLSFGLRFDWQSGLYEQHARFSTFDPTAQNPVGHLGATIFNSSKANGNSNWATGPRFGFAYALNNKTVIRGGYGIYYAGAQADSWDPYPVDGYQTNPTAPNLTNGLFPAFYFQGTGTCPAQERSLNVSCGWPSGSIVLPPQLKADVANGGNPVGVDPKTYTTPRYQNWSVSFQRQLTQNMAIDIAYVGNHGTRLVDGRSSVGVYDNMNPGSVLSLGPVLTTGTFTNGVPNAAAVAAGFTTPPYPGFSGDIAQSLRMWPQYQQINWRYFPDGKSHYNAFQVSLDRRLNHGLQFKVAYTYSRLMNNGAETGLGSGGPPVQNPSDMRDLYTVSSDDVPQILSLGWVYQLPFGKGKWIGGNSPAVVDKLISHWQLSAIQTYQAGRPLSITMANNSLGGYLFNYTEYPNKVSNKALVGNFHDPNTDTYLNSAAWADPGQFAFGNAPRNDENVRGFGYRNEDFSIYKDTYFSENRYFRFQADAGNIANRVFFCPVGTALGNANFGKTGSQCNIPRRIQLALQVFF